MLSEYLVTAFRALTRHRIHLALNLFGLAVGLAAALLIALYTLCETSYDAFQPKVESTYRVVQHHIEADVYHPLISPAIQADIEAVAGVSDVMSLTATTRKIDQAVRVGDQFLKLRDVYAATENVESFIDLHVLHGDLEQALTRPDAIALSRSEAERFFGRTDVVGEGLITGNKTWTVAAVFADLPKNTHFAVKGLINATQFVPAVFRYDAYAYVRLGADAEPDHVAADIAHVINARTHQGKEVMDVLLQPVRDIHLSSLYGFRMTPPGSKRTVGISIALSAILLLIASFNFVNMSTAQAGLRATEVGVRKSLGASKGQLVFQFLTESILVTALGALFACTLAELALPYFNELIGRRLSIEYLGEFGIVVVATTLFVGLLAGLYPALFLSSFSARRTLSGDLQRGLTAAWVRKSLLALQAALSIGLIVGAGTLWRQLEHLNDLSLGYEKANRAKVSTIEQREFPHLSQDDALYDALRDIEGVTSVTPGDLDLTTALNASVQLRMPGADGPMENVGYAGVGFEAVETLGLNLLAGRDFSTRYRSDWFNREGDRAALGVLVTESLLQVAGFDSPESALDQHVVFDGGPLTGVSGRIVGVVQDVRVGSIRNPVVPTIFGCGLSWTGSSSIYVKLLDENLTRVAEPIRETLRQRLDMDLVEIELVEDRYAALYQGERQQAQVVFAFSGLAVFLTCVGIFGMASFSAQRRGREVAIRKVMGASRLGLVNLIAQEYLVLTGVSVLIAFPAAYWTLNDWLNNFNERIDQSLSTYALAATAVVGITWVTVSVVALRVASLRPSLILRED